MTDDAKTRQFPEGIAFFDLVAKTEFLCSQETSNGLEGLGKKAPECHRRLGSLLSALYRESCCDYGCPGGDHFGQRIAGRVVSHSLGSYRLLMSGYYDESFALTRNLGELANLFFLFWLHPDLVREWRAADKTTRGRKFSAVKVRLQLEEGGDPVPIDQARYAGLCEVAVHIGPETNPQAHNPLGVPTLGGCFQSAAFLATLNELAEATSVCAASLVPHLDLGERKMALLRSARDLLQEVGGVSLISLQEKFSNIPSVSY